MSKVWLLVFFSAVLFGAAGVAEGEASCPCIAGGANPEPPGVRISLIDQTVLEIDGSQPSFVLHGWGWDASCAGMYTSAEAICVFAREHMRFELRVNGVDIDPALLASGERLLEPSYESCVPPPGSTIFGAEWVFEFPSSYFAPGVYVLEGTWSFVDYPIACIPCSEEALADMEEEGVWVIGETTVSRIPPQRSLTLTVLYPEHP
jgi:hypothetical protein